MNNLTTLVKENFILQQSVSNINICDDLIKYHQQSTNKFDGETFKGVNKKVKDSTDVVLDPESNVGKEYIKQLLEVTDNYVKTFPYCDYYDAWGIVENILIQHYKPKGGFFGLHTERGSKAPIKSARHLVFMTYLNDVVDGGETEFIHQNLRIKPKKGMTLIWLPDWTYTHRGIPSDTQDKYVVTGWFNFI